MQHETSGGKDSRINIPDINIRLPSEIFYEVLTLALAHITSSIGEINTTTPLALGAVCSWWRGIIWASPLLWTDIKLHISGSRRAETQLSLLRDWISRTHGQLLSVTIRADPSVGQMENPYRDCISDILRLISKISSQWRAIDMDFPMYRAVRASLSFSGLPNLVSASLCASSKSDGLPFLFFMQFSDAPQLRELVLDGAEAVKRAQILDWKQVEYIHINSCNDYQCPLLLRVTHNARHLKFENIFPMHTSFSLPLLIHDAETVEILTDKPDLPISLISRFTFRSLLDLRILLSCEANRLFLPPIIALITRSSCPLESLTLKFGCTIPFEEDLIELLRMTTSLTSLNLILPASNRETIASGLSERFFKSLYPAESAFVQILPNLQTLIYEGPLLVSSETLQETLKNRWSPSDASSRIKTNPNANYISRLNTVSIKSYNSLGVQDDCVLALKALRDEGMQISITMNGETCC
ncbi:hypothetical protein BDQ12DRAFT_725390 [Crucibulum laeve]|uniref:F-box domain-containing protein n=1 Tax=Crucibulum laeve TaxID=68775 RepID=A0A5C3LU54_9AGAR|nr:hypothetical protein BDQ12DRAFT_725390 [Crucibulum laeve]